MMGVDQVDLVLLSDQRKYDTGLTGAFADMWKVHPLQSGAVSLVSQGMEGLRGKLTKNLAVVDFSEKELEQLKKFATVMPTTNQVDFETHCCNTSQDVSSIPVENHCLAVALPCCCIASFSQLIYACLQKLTQYCEGENITLTSHEDTERMCLCTSPWSISQT